MESKRQAHDGEFSSIQIIPYKMELKKQSRDGEFSSIQIIPYKMESNRQYFWGPIKWRFWDPHDVKFGPGR